MNPAPPTLASARRQFASCLRSARLESQPSSWPIPHPARPIAVYKIYSRASGRWIGACYSYSVFAPRTDYHYQFNVLYAVFRDGSKVPCPQPPESER